jgi:muramidase (phage lysozyme)
MSLRDKILAADDIPSEIVTIDEWDVDLLVRGMSAGGRITLMQNAYDQTTGQVNMAAVYPDVVVSCVFDPESKDAVFSETDKTALMDKASGAIEQIANVALRLSGIGQDAQDAAGKDSLPIQSDDSSSS